ncbi:hypothetical protein BX592_11889 [Paraburkholderia rhizosphaerae]|uniref:Protein-tyrosine-phosphatase n=2 Tax=Paraburkholderia rhizosphaerae TaxID=480658 RepID=A0A4R8LIP0_9BURK|nr:hypothetical protein BX592_11889 [Paraburkholderia rhizosphaerae]
MVSAGQVVWADIIFVMERAHKVKLSKKFGSYLKGKQVVCLDVPDKYALMQPELIAVLERKVGYFSRSD